VANLIDWTYEPLHPYAELQELYGQILGQWNRYMGHVATTIGGVTQIRKTYDQEGPVYTFVPKESQQRAMQFFVDQAFTTPTWMLNEDILTRVENIGAVERIRGAQVRVVNLVLDPGRMQRLIETEARIGNDAYTLGEMLADLRGGIWTEITSGASTDAYRRNLQRGYLERMAYLMTEEPAPPANQFMRAFRTAVDVSQSDIRAFVRGELETLKRQLEAARNHRDRATRLHYRDAVQRIDRILDPED